MTTTFDRPTTVIQLTVVKPAAHPLRESGYHDVLEARLKSLAGRQSGGIQTRWNCSPRKLLSTLVKSTVGSLRIFPQRALSKRRPQKLCAWTLSKIFSVCAAVNEDFDGEFRRVVALTPISTNDLLMTLLLGL